MENAENAIHAIRSNATFETFEVTNDDQMNAVECLSMLADSIAKKAPDILFKPNPFDYGRFVFLVGKPGRGKTHLVEAFANRLKQKAPALVKGNKIFFDRARFTLRHVLGDHGSDYDGAPVVICDDLWSEHATLAKVDHDATYFMRYVFGAYERRSLTIFTSNFPVRDGIEKLVAARDPVGRVTSRLRELLHSSAELTISGDDYRRTLAQQRAASAFAV